MAKSYYGIRNAGVNRSAAGSPTANTQANNSSYGIRNAGVNRAATTSPTAAKDVSYGGTIPADAKGSKTVSNNTSSTTKKSSGSKSGGGSTVAPAVSTPAFSYAGGASDAALASLVSPGAFSSQYETTLNNLYNQIANREKFSYDFNKDAMYKMYKDNYIAQGKKAMEDTIGTASALTGGYASSYSQTAGQQTYQNYLQKLNDVIMTLRNNAKEEYDDEGNRLNNLFGLANTMYGNDWNKYRAAVSDYQADRSYHQAQANADRDFAYKMYLASLG